MKSGLSQLTSPKAGRFEKTRQITAEQIHGDSAGDHPELQCERRVLGQCCPSRMCAPGLEFKYQPGAGQSTKESHRERCQGDLSHGPLRRGGLVTEKKLSVFLHPSQADAGESKFWLAGQSPLKIFKTGGSCLPPPYLPPQLSLCISAGAWERGSGHMFLS